LAAADVAAWRVGSFAPPRRDAGNRDISGRVTADRPGPRWPQAVMAGIHQL